MTLSIQLRQINVPPGQQLQLQPVSWSEFENILTELGDRRSARLAYHHQTLEIMTPLPEHEDDKEMLGDLVKALLEAKEIEFRTLGSTTFKNPAMTQAIEPDQCFYIQNEAKIRGKKRLDLTTDPPPDLAIEIDITSRTHLDIYAALGVPEIWRKSGDNLQINILCNGEYVAVAESPTFPGLPVQQLLEYVAQSKVLGRNKVLKSFRQWLKNQ